MVYDELEMLQKLKHPHIVKFVDWFESRVSSPIPNPRLCQGLDSLAQFNAPPCHAMWLTVLASLGQVLHRNTARHRW
jgi:serine/threonine protein kinase